MASSYFSSDTIAAIATSLAGDGGVGIIRVSGPQSLRCAQLRTRGLEEPAPRYLHRIDVLDSESGDVIDDGLGVYFPEGQSFTGESVVELQLHGGRFTLQRILHQIVSDGVARLALPGEFSFRAVRNGKMSLSGAQAVAQLVTSKSLFEAQASRRILSDSRYSEFESLAGKIRQLMAQTELSIDFIDQDVEVISEAELRAQLKGLAGELAVLLSKVRAAQRIARGLSVTFIGEPNAGKSTLFNALLAEDRAIVSADAGTTRDVITEELRIGPYFVRVADTAGIRDANGAIEREGIERARLLAGSSELSILVLDASLPAEALCVQAKTLPPPGGELLIVLNKSDLLPDESALSAKEAALAPICSSVVRVAARTAQGVASLAQKIRESLDRQVGIGVGAFLATEFQTQMLVECESQIQAADDVVEQAGLASPELLASALKGAAAALSDLVGETTPDTVLAKIFSEFCIGK